MKLVVQTSQLAIQGRQDKGVTPTSTLYPGEKHEPHVLPLNSGEHLVHVVPLEHSRQFGIASGQGLQVKGPVVEKNPVSQESQRLPR